MNNIIAYLKGDIESDVEAVEAAKRLGYRILELLNV